MRQQVRYAKLYLEESPDHYLAADIDDRTLAVQEAKDGKLVWVVLEPQIQTSRATESRGSRAVGE
jgi:hypothetical protein